jgi:hypothetical protein
MPDNSECLIEWVFRVCLGSLIFVGLIGVGLVVMATLEAIQNMPSQEYSKNNKQCYSMFGRLHETPTKFICYGSPVNGQPVVYFEVDK